MGAGAGLLVKVLLNGLHAGELTRGLIRRCDTLLRAGCIVSAVIVWLCCEADVSSQSPFVLALGPIVLVALISIRQPVFESATPLSRYQREQRRLRSILLTLLVFFQSGGEWILAGWLPYWAMRSFGTSTTVAILMIPAFFAAQLLSRLAFERFLQKLIGRRLLVGACVVSASGLLVLTASASSAAAYVGTLLAGSGLGAAYPSLSKTFDDRFTFDAPLYTALLLSGILGAMMFAWLFAYLDRWLGLSALPLLPMAGVTSVLVLGFLAMLERRLMGESTTLPDTSAS
jgi:fucose permease